MYHNKNTSYYLLGSCERKSIVQQVENFAFAKVYYMNNRFQDYQNLVVKVR